MLLEVIVLCPPVLGTWLLDLQPGPGTSAALASNPKQDLKWPRDLRHSGVQDTEGCRQFPINAA